MTESCVQIPWRLAEATTLASPTSRGRRGCRTSRAVFSSREVTTVPRQSRASLRRASSATGSTPISSGDAEAADEVAAAVRTGERIVVFGDFDLDGISSAAVAARAWLHSGPTCARWSRTVSEGYGSRRRRSNAS